MQGLNPGPLPGDTGQYANLRFYWKLENNLSGGETQGWNRTSGYFYRNGISDNSLSWTGAPGLTNRDFILRAWHDEDDDQEPDATESRRSLHVKVMEKVEVEQLAFVPLDANITLPIIVQPAIEYTLILSREQGATGWATFDDGATTRQVQGSTNIVIHGVTLSTALKDMRLKAITASGQELAHRDFTVGQIQIQVSDEWNGMSLVSIPLTNAASAVAVVPPNGYVSLRAVGVPQALEQSFGWQVGANPQITNSASLVLTSGEAGELEINLTIDDPQKIPMFVGFPVLTNVEGHDVMAPAGPYAEAITYPARYSSWATMEYELLETYHAAYGYADGGRYEATAHLFGNSAGAECHVWPEQEQEGGAWISQNPGAPCAVCSVINFTLLEEELIGVYHPLMAEYWSGDGVAGNVTDTASCSVGPIGPGTNFIVIAHTLGGDYEREYATYADVVQSLACGGVVVTNEEKVLYLSYEQQSVVTTVVTAVKFCANCPWAGGFSGPVSGQHVLTDAGNRKEGRLILPAPGPYEVSIGQGGVTLSMDVEGLYVKFADTNSLNLAWTQGGSYNMSNALAANIYSPSGLVWSGGASNNGVLYFGSNGASYNIHVVSSNLSSCYDDKTVNVLKVESVDVHSFDTNTYKVVSNLGAHSNHFVCVKDTGDISTRPANPYEGGVVILSKG